ncbi:IQ domain-containing protein C [Solea senegalensis]|uniref:IQ domain-containing protein C n=1 Tax=Solea senegalensis TaxID=28829 RepID=A0AAV6S4M9_SOLSE|nr:IQ domain-containing protein C [Solea senegalensis]KAG7510796.1 IQ domain-containing protein C [Solea senegalensis]
MDWSKLDKTLVQFQARARGYLVRKELARAREDFEDIVKEIDGDLTHVQWKDTIIIATPHFTDTDDPFPPSSDVSLPSDPGLDVSARPQSPAASAASLSSDRGGDQTLFSQKTEAERDDSETNSKPRLSRDCFPSSYAGEDVEDARQKDQEEDKDGGLMESTGNSTTIWSSLELDVSNSHHHQGLRQYCSAQEVPRTPEALRLHRNTLTMELVWLQQAIDSRKKYLSLKDRLTMS